MAEDAGRLARLARAWDDAAVGYERYFVPRFAPWLRAGVDALGHGPLPAGPLVVPCCGTFPELPALLREHPGRDVVGVDLSEGMVRLARERAAGLDRVRVVQGDATTLRTWCPDGCAGLVSVFGLQQLPDPESAIADWAATLRPGGRLSVVYWPEVLEDTGPFAFLDTLFADVRAAPAESWQDRLASAVTGAGGEVEHDTYTSFPMEHPDAETFWDAMADDGPLRSLANARGAAFMGRMRAEFVRRAPSGGWRHRPRARHVVAALPLTSSR